MSLQVGISLNVSVKMNITVFPTRACKGGQQRHRVLSRTGNHFIQVDESCTFPVFSNQSNLQKEVFRSFETKCLLANLTINQPELRTGSNRS
jgi:hypothetical protein